MVQACLHNIMKFIHMQPVLTSNSLVAMATAYLQTRSVMEIMTVEMTVMKTAVSM